MILKEKEPDSFRLKNDEWCLINLKQHKEETDNILYYLFNDPYIINGSSFRMVSIEKKIYFVRKDLLNLMSAGTGYADSTLRKKYNLYGEKIIVPGIHSDSSDSKEIIVEWDKIPYVLDGKEKTNEKDYSLKWNKFYHYFKNNVLPTIKKTIIDHGVQENNTDQAEQIKDEGKINISNLDISSNIPQVFSNPKFGSIRILMINNKAWFVRKDVAAILGYNLSYENFKRFIEECKLIMHPITDNTGQMQNLCLIDESGLYDFISQSSNESKRIKQWITSEIIPSIYKQNTYNIKDVQKDILDNPDFLIKVLTELKEDRQLFNRCVRVLSVKCYHDIKYSGRIYKDIYTELYNKWGISLKARKIRSGVAGSYIDFLRKDEWWKLMQTFDAICIAAGFSPTEIIKNTYDSYKKEVCNECH